MSFPLSILNPKPENIVLWILGFRGKGLRFRGASRGSGAQPPDVQHDGHLLATQLKGASCGNTGAGYLSFKGYIGDIQGFLGKL